MTATLLPREFGTTLVCNGCKAKETTATVGKERIREWFRGKGWGRGSDPGTKRKDGTGRLSNKRPDLCPECLKLDKAAARERKVARDKQIAARDLKRKERDGVVRHAKAQAEADSR